MTYIEWHTMLTAQTSLIKLMNEEINVTFSDTETENIIETIRILGSRLYIEEEQ